VKKLLAVTAGSVALGVMGLLAAGEASSDNSGAADVSGNTYAMAVKLLKSQGYRPTFGGSVGSDVPQAQCIVESQKFMSNARVSLMLNCTKAAQPAPAAADPNAPVVGANGVTTVKATPAPPKPVELAPAPPPLMPPDGG
jgi:hypothetical protein